jgi:hypothetical protein
MHVPCHLHAPVTFVAQLANHIPHGFEAQTKKPSWWFHGPNHQTTAVSFVSQMGKSIDLGFEAKPRNPRSSSPCARCKLHTASPDLMIVPPPSTQPMLDHPRSSAPSHLLLSRSLSLPTMLHLSPTHHEASKHISPCQIDSRIEPPKFPRFKFKPRQVNYSSQIKPRY